MNRVIISGRVTKDPDLRYTTGENPMAIATFTVAVKRRFVKEGKPDADFPRVTVMGKAAENFVAKYVKQGSTVEVDGELRTGSYEKDGVKHYTTDVVVDSFSGNIGFSPQKSQDKPAEEKAEEKPSVPPGFQEVADDDVPF